MTKQNYLSEFSSRFTQLVETEEILNTQKELCKVLFEDYLEKPIGRASTQILKNWSVEMKKYNIYSDLYIDLTREFWGLRKHFISNNNK